MYKLKIDCHNHDTRSDGINNIIDFANKACELKLDMCAISNHDIIDRKLKILLKDTNIIVPESVEISAQNYDSEMSLHLTCYSDNFSREVDKVLEDSLIGKKQMLELQAKKLSEFGFKVSFNDVLEFNLLKGKKIDSLNKFSISEFIYNGKYSNYNKKFIKQNFGEEEDIKWLFFNLLKKGGEFYEKFRVHVSDYEPSIEKIGQLAKSSNAILSIAHPNFTFKSGIEDFKNEISYYVDRGINAIEINPFADKKWIETILELKKKYDLILTFGSDCHKLGWIDDKHHDFGTMNTFISDEIINENFKKFREKIGV